MKKRILFPLIIFSLLPLSGCSDNGNIFNKGDGSEANPFVIETSKQMRELSSAFYSEKEEYYSAHYVLANDIKLGGIPFSPIGAKAMFPFNGVFDGNGHKIYGFSIGKYAKNAGLFAILGDEAVVKNLTVSTDIKRSGFGYNAGAIAGVTSLGSVIENCHACGSLIYDINDDGLSPRVDINSYGKIPDLANIVGGIVGVNAGEVINCSSSINIRGDIIGGICGSSSGVVESCNVNDINLEGRNIVGGIIGHTHSLTAKVNYCSAINVEASTFDTFGGIVGTATGILNVESCQFVGKVSYLEGVEEQTLGTVVGYLTGDGQLPSTMDSYFNYLIISHSISSVYCVPSSKKLTISNPKTSNFSEKNNRAFNNVAFVSLNNEAKQSNITITGYAGSGQSLNYFYVPQAYAKNSTFLKEKGKESVELMASTIKQNASDFIKLDGEIYGYQLKNITKGE